MSLCEEDAAIKAAKDVMVQMASNSDMRGKCVSHRLDGVVKKSVCGDVRVFEWEDDKFGREDADSVGDVRKELGGQIRAAGTTF